MEQENKVKAALAAIIHPETNTDIVSSGIVDGISTDNGKISITLNFPKSRDPFANSIKKQVAAVVSEIYPDVDVSVIVKENAPKQKNQNTAEKVTTTTGIGNIIAIASGKGGVGKSTVTANLALTLRNMGYKVGILDADIYGPSQPKMFGLEDYVPDAIEENGIEYIVPGESQGIKIASIGFFIQPSDALVWRGPMATNALRQLIHQTKWDDVDYLLIDLPPGTGDIHLSVVGELKVDGAVIVSTPQQVAVADVLRGIKMFAAPGIEIPVLGIIENMAWFTPMELPDNKYYIFGHGGAKQLAEQENIPFLGEVPIIQSVMEGAEEGNPAAGTNYMTEKYFREIADKIVKMLRK